MSRVSGRSKMTYKSTTTVKTEYLAEYFGDDEVEDVKNYLQENEYFYQEHVVNFSYSQYIEFLLIHLISFVILGPFIIVYNLIWRKNPHLMYNLQFAPRNSISFYW